MLLLLLIILCFILSLFLPLQKQIIVDPLSFSEERFRPSLEERLESIISGAALMADSSCTRDDRRERIVAECNSVRQALQDLLSEYMGNVGARQILFFLLVYCFSPSTVPHPWMVMPSTHLLPEADALQQGWRGEFYFRDSAHITFAGWCCIKTSSLITICPVPPSFWREGFSTHKLLPVILICALNCLTAVVFK